MNAKKVGKMKKSNENEKRYCGVDLGLNGAIVVTDDAQQVLFKTVMPVYKSTKAKTQYDILQIVDIFEQWMPTFTYIEKAMLIPVSGKSAFYGNGLCMGIFQGILTTMKLKYDIIMPQRWQKSMFAGLSHTDTKQASIALARRYAPATDWRATERSTKYHDGLTDAYCLALYCRRMNGGQE